MHSANEDVSVCSVVDDEAWSVTELESAGLCTSRWPSEEDGKSSRCEAAVDSVSVPRTGLKPGCCVR